MTAGLLLSSRLVIAVKWF